MNNHLSQEQFARCFVGSGTHEEQQHVLSCSQCNTELEQFGNAVSSLRLGIREHVDAHNPTPIVLPSGLQRIPRMRWALAAAAVLLLGTAPFLIEKPREEVIAEVQTESPEAPEELMEAISVHLSRTIPSPMEPMMFIPSEDSIAEAGGVQ
jgi:hypothetical protein